MKLTEGFGQYPIQCAMAFHNIAMNRHDGEIINFEQFLKLAETFSPKGKVSFADRISAGKQREMAQLKAVKTLEEKQVKTI